MPDWKTTVKIGDIHEQYQNRSIKIQEVAKQLAARLRLNRYKDEPSIQDGIKQLDEMLKDPDSTGDDYDYILRGLYEFGDEGHRIWFDSTR